MYSPQLLLEKSNNEYVSRGRWHYELPIPLLSIQMDGPSLVGYVYRDTGNRVQGSRVYGRICATTSTVSHRARSIILEMIDLGMIRKIERRLVKLDKMCWQLTIPIKCYRYTATVCFDRLCMTEGHPHLSRLILASHEHTRMSPKRCRTSSKVFCMASNLKVDFVCFSIRVRAHAYSRLWFGSLRDIVQPCGCKGTWNLQLNIHRPSLVCCI